MDWTTVTMALAVLCGAALCQAAQESEVIELWPEKVRRQWDLAGHEQSKTDPWRGGPDTITRLTNVVNPTLTFFRPEKPAPGHPAVIVCPGGGYSILAWDLEGTEVAAWLNSLGITAFVLKYRVPRQRGGAFQDCQRAVSLVRSRAADFGIAPQRIGILGFSAGGHLAARVCTNWRKRAYEAADEADEASPRPDFAILIYPAYMAKRDGLDRETLPIGRHVPPTFIAIAAADKFATGALCYATALKQAKVRFELHVFAVGSHGSGLRPPAVGLTTWPDRCEEWLRAIGILAKDGQ